LISFEAGLFKTNKSFSLLKILLSLQQNYGGAQPMAEIIPFEPETGNTGKGRKSHHLQSFPELQFLVHS